MIETASGVYAARDIAAHPAAKALVAGLNDLAMDLGVPDPANRAAMMTAIQTILLAARAAGVLAYDGVWTGLDDEAGLIAECGEGRALGFDGKTLIHPNQISACNAAWLPSQADVDQAQAMIAAVAAGSTSGAIRFQGKMVEDMHIKAAQRLIARAALRGVRQE
jgi:citrate lyase beta subunit